MTVQILLLGAYYNKKNVPSPLGSILLILKRKRPHLYGEMGHFQHLQIHISRAPRPLITRDLHYFTPGTMPDRMVKMPNLLVLIE